TLFGRDAFPASEIAARRALARLDEAAHAAPEIARLRASILAQIGHVRRALGDYREADALLRASLAVAKCAFGAASCEVAEVLNGIGIVCKYAGWYARGERAYRRALAIAEERLGSAH